MVSIMVIVMFDGWDDRDDDGWNDGDSWDDRDGDG